MRTYRQYCPIARASELLAERWTMIIVRNVLAGCRTFGEIAAGAPGIPPALLSQRLAALERHGVVRRRPKPEGRGWLYEPTESGRELQDVCDAMGRWGARWLEMDDSHIDPAYVLWATMKLVDVSRLGERGLVVRVDLRDRPGERYWLLLREPAPELCSSPHGFVEDLVVETDAACLVDIHLERTTFRAAARSGRTTFIGPTVHSDALIRAVRTSPYAAAYARS